jgi:hypothetical protein
MNVNCLTLMLTTAGLLGCATRMTMTRPLTADQIEDLQGQTANATVRVQPIQRGALQLELDQVRFSPDAISGLLQKAPRTLAIDEVDSFQWKSRGKGFARGALAGLLLGPLVGAVAGATLVPLSSPDDENAIHGAQGFFIGVFIGPLIGGIIGACIGVDDRVDVVRVTGR